MDYQKIRRKNEKLPLAEVLHYNWFLSLVFAALIGHLAFYKHKHLYFCNSFQRSLLIPVYSIWFIAEIPRLYVGQKGILCDKVRALYAVCVATDACI